MNKYFTLGAALLLFGTGIVGCSNTAEGAKEDANQNGQKVAKAADNAGQTVADATKGAADATKDAAKNADAATVVTPQVKNAISADKTLNDPKNLIDVDSADNVVHLKGHVATNDMKKLAGQIAEKALKDGNRTDKVSNELKVDAH